MGTPVKRPAQRNATCRVCYKPIQKGEEIISWYSPCGQGQHIIMHLKCAEAIGELAKKNDLT